MHQAHPFIHKQSYPKVKHVILGETLNSYLNINVPRFHARYSTCMRIVLNIYSFLASDKQKGECLFYILLKLIYATNPNTKLGNNYFLPRFIQFFLITVLVIVRCNINIHHHFLFFRCLLIYLTLQNNPATSTLFLSSSYYIPS